MSSQLAASVWSQGVHETQIYSVGGRPNYREHTTREYVSKQARSCFGTIARAEKRRRRGRV